MSKLFTGIFLALFCLFGLISVRVPEWILPVAAGVAALFTLLEFKSKQM